MIEEEAVVASIVDGQVWIEKERATACGSCAHRCATGVVEDHWNSIQKKIRLKVISSIDLNVGDRVLVGIPENAIVSGSFWLYLIPLFGLLFGSIMGRYAVSSFAIASLDGGDALGGLFGLIASFIFLRYTRVLSRNETLPVVIRKIH